MRKKTHRHRNLPLASPAALSFDQRKLRRPCLSALESYREGLAGILSRKRVFLSEFLHFSSYSTMRVLRLGVCAWFSTSDGNALPARLPKRDSTFPGRLLSVGHQTVAGVLAPGEGDPS